MLAGGEHIFALPHLQGAYARCPGVGRCKQCLLASGGHRQPPMPCVLLLGCRCSSWADRGCCLQASSACSLPTTMVANSSPPTQPTDHPTIRPPIPPTHSTFIPYIHPPAGGGLAGYQQQDAHEFFCFVLEMMAATAGPGEPRLLRAWSLGARGAVSHSQPAFVSCDRLPALAAATYVTNSPTSPPNPALPRTNPLCRQHHATRVWRHAAL